MKYIRTKDKILLFRDYEDIDSVLTNIGWIHKTEIVKQADTIEELCDEYFAISNTNYKSHITIDFENKIVCQCKNIHSKYTFEQFMPYHTIYGAVWTDKGLIYVAKLNEKGNWELI